MSIARYGTETWDKVIGSTTWGWHPFAFSRALKKHTGASAPQTYEQTMDELTELWQVQQKRSAYNTVAGAGWAEPVRYLDELHISATVSRWQCASEQEWLGRFGEAGAATPRRT